MQFIKLKLKNISINDKGTEIISGTVNLTALGRNNETIKDIPATFNIIGLTQLRMSKKRNMTVKYLSDMTQL